MEVFAARQPILDSKLRVHGYELLYRARSDMQTAQDDRPWDDRSATLDVISQVVQGIGLDTLTRGSLAFINFPGSMLLEDMAELLQPQQTVIEILECSKPSLELLEKIRHLTGLGFQIALDDFSYDPSWHAIIDVVDIIKIDIRSTPWEEQERLIKRYRTHRVRFLAEKVETHEEFERCCAMGYELFQGYFFQKPILVTGRDLQSYSGIPMLLWQMLHGDSDQLDYGKMEEIAKRDPAVTYKLLRFINSAFYGLRQPVRSVRQALVLLGRQELRRWITLLLLRGHAVRGEEELLLTALVRASFCEKIAQQIAPARSEDAFFSGLFSLLDTFFGMPLPEILQQLPIHDDVRDAILGRPGFLAQLLDVARSMEKGEWEEVAKHTKLLGMSGETVQTAYLDAIFHSQHYYMPYW